MLDEKLQKLVLDHGHNMSLSMRVSKFFFSKITKGIFDDNVADLRGVSRKYLFFKFWKYVLLVVDPSSS